MTSHAPLAPRLARAWPHAWLHAWPAPIARSQAGCSHGVLHRLVFQYCTYTFGSLREREAQYNVRVSRRLIQAPAAKPCGPPRLPGPFYCPHTCALASR